MDCIEVSIVGSVVNLDVGVGGGRRRRLGVRLVAVVGSLKLYVLSAMNVLRLRLGRLELRLRLLLGRLGRLLRLSIARVLVDMKLLTVLRGLLSVELLGLGSLLKLLLLLGRLGTTKTLLFVDVNFFLDVGVVALLLLLRLGSRRRR